MITDAAISALNGHWAVEALDSEDVARAKDLANRRLLGTLLPSEGKVLEDTAAENDLLERVATAYELAAAEGLHDLLHPPGPDADQDLGEQAEAGAYLAYDLLRAVPIPSEPEALILRVLHLSALAYCSDRWAELRRWLNENWKAITPPTAEGAPWDSRILNRLYDCWLRLLRKQGWDDLTNVAAIVSHLRNEQSQYEPERLEASAGLESKSVALRLLALYNLARATELLGEYTVQGTPGTVRTQLDHHFETAQSASSGAGDAPFEVLVRWLHVAARRMVAGSVWTAAEGVSPNVTKFISGLTKAGMFELLPPQRAALHEQGLLDVASRAIAVDLPTSGGKTVLAQFRMLQALNQFSADQGWVAYVAPTRALVSQLSRRLRRDFEPLGISVEQLSSAVEIDSFEASLLSAEERKFDVLVATPEKLDLVIRNRGAPRPLALVVMDEAHNLEDQERGLRIELLLATIKRENPASNFLLLMPYVPNPDDLTRWLAPEAGRTISLGTSVWQPNERVIGTYEVERSTEGRAGWKLRFDSIITTRRTIEIEEKFKVGPSRPIDMPFSEARDSLSKQTAAMSRIFSERGTSIAVGTTIPNVWAMASAVAASVGPLSPVPDEIALVQRFLAAEISPQFELISHLSRGVGVHHAGLSDEARDLMEWLTEEGHLRVLCATTTIAQGINFPVSSVFLASRYFPFGREMSPRTFWNLAGRAGRVYQDNVGVIGLAAGKDIAEVQAYIGFATEKLVSRLVSLMNDVAEQGQLANLTSVMQEEQWDDFRSYVAHLWAQKRDLDQVLSETEQLLRNTFGYGVLQRNKDELSREKAKALLEATRAYATSLAAHPENAILADATGFAPEGVRNALLGLNDLDRSLTPKDWEPGSLFGSAKSSMLPDLVGVMLKIPQIRRDLERLGTHGYDYARIANIARAWVGGRPLEQIAKNFFLKENGSLTDAITQTCRSIYGVLSNVGTWGLSALTKLPTSGLAHAEMSDEDRRRINTLPAMLYHGVASESAVLMRMNSVPRTIAEPLGKRFDKATRAEAGEGVRGAREFLTGLDDSEWDAVRPAKSPMSGSDYRKVWRRLSGAS